MFNKLNKHKIVRAGGLIFDKNFEKVILVLNKNSFANQTFKYVLPKGHLENSEEMADPTIGAQREILEETGIYIPIHKFDAYLKIYDTIYYIISLEEDIKNFKANDNEEISFTGWFSIESIKFLNVNRTLLKLRDSLHNIAKLTKNEEIEYPMILPSPYEQKKNLNFKEYFEDKPEIDPQFFYSYTVLASSASVPPGFCESDCFVNRNIKSNKRNWRM